MSVVWAVTWQTQNIMDNMDIATDFISSVSFCYQKRNSREVLFKHPLLWLLVCVRIAVMTIHPEDAETVAKDSVPICNPSGATPICICI